MSEERKRSLSVGEFEDWKLFLDERLKRTETRFLLYIGVAVGLIRFDMPASITAAAVVAMSLKGLLAFFGRF